MVRVVMCDDRLAISTPAETGIQASWLTKRGLAKAIATFTVIAAKHSHYLQIMPTSRIEDLQK